MPLSDSQQVVAKGEVLSRALDGETVILDLGAGRYYGLNEVGSEAWELIVAGTTVGDLRRHLLTRFDVEESTLKADLAELLAELKERALIDVSS